MREGISIGMPEDVKAEMDLHTQAEGISRSSWVWQAPQEYLFVRKFRALCGRMMSLAWA